MKIEQVKEINFLQTNPLFREKINVEIHLDGKAWVNAKTHNHIVSYAGMLKEEEKAILQQAVLDLDPRKLSTDFDESLLHGEYASLGVKTTQKSFWAILDQKDQRSNSAIRQIMATLIPLAARITSGSVILPDYTQAKIKS